MATLAAMLCVFGVPACVSTRSTGRTDGEAVGEPRWAGDGAASVPVKADDLGSDDPTGDGETDGGPDGDAPDDRATDGGADRDASHRGERGGEGDAPWTRTADMAAAPTAGSACQTAGDCASRWWPAPVCLGWPGGYCSSDCDPEGACEEGTCAVLEDGSRRCLAACDHDGHCRTGYRCVPGDEWSTCQPRSAPRP